MTSKRFWDWFIFPGGIWIALLFAIPLSPVLVLSFGHVDDFPGRGVYGFSLDNYRDVFDATYIARCCSARSVTRLATVILPALIGYPVAYFIARFGAGTATRCWPPWSSPSSPTTWSDLPGSPCSPTRAWSTTCWSTGLSQQPIQFINTPSR